LQQSNTVLQQSSNFMNSDHLLCRCFDLAWK